MNDQPSTVSRWLHAAVCVGVLALLVVACSVFLDHDPHQCQTDADCCNGVSCTQGGGISFCNGATGCTCVNLIPR